MTMTATCPNPNCRHRTKRKLRPLVISVIPSHAVQNTKSRHHHITDMFTKHPSLAFHFEPPVFSPGVPSRDIRNRIKFLHYANEAGLIPEVEWEGIQRAINEQTLVLTGEDNGISSANEDHDNKPKHETIDPFRYLATTTIIKESDKNNNENQHENNLAADEQVKAKKKKWYPETETKSLVPISPDRRGPDADVLLPYSMELWRKGKALNRDRSVFACTLAHLIAMKKLVGGSDDNNDGADSLHANNNEGGFDFILEDNVRAFLGVEEQDGEATINNDSNVNVDDWTGWSCECANRIWDFIESSQNEQVGEEVIENTASSDGVKVTQCHLRYFGWLGSQPNLTWLYRSHIPRSAFGVNGGSNPCKAFPFPTKQDMALDADPELKSPRKSQNDMQSDDEEALPEANQLQSSHSDAKEPKFSTPGGTAVFGAFAYTISAPAYKSLIHQLQNDVGSMLWKSKKMRAYKVKAIDKILPRHVREQFGRESVHVTDQVAFVRGPMLGSMLHQHWDKAFCESTEWQFCLSCSKSIGDNSESIEVDGSEVWDHVWLPKDERRVVNHRKITGRWLRKEELVDNDTH